MKDIVIFGAGQIAEIAHFYFSTDTPYRIGAFCVDSEYIKETTFCGLPVVPFEDLVKTHPPNRHSLFVAISYIGLNQVRTAKVREARAIGYDFASYLSSKASVWPGFKLEDNCLILEDNTIQPFALVGSNVTLWSGNHIGHHSRIHDNCFISSHVVVSGNVTIQERTFVGVNATIRDGVTIGEGCLIGAGCLVMADAEADTLLKAPSSKPASIPASKLNF
jgi:sugar O-acyltransferase (sialic acid O-acetyltransferase NeuD family)